MTHMSAYPDRKPLNMRRVWVISTAGWITITIATTALDYFLAMLMNYYREGPRITLTAALRFSVVEYTYWALTTPAILALTRGLRFSRKTLSRSLLICTGWFFVFWCLHSGYRAASNNLLYQMPPGTTFVALLNYYLLAKVGKDFWVFGTIVGFNQIREHYSRETARDNELARAQLLLLKRQVQPHFLFNTLNSISTLMHHNVDAADDMLTELSALLRATLKTNSAMKVDLAHEIELLKSYLSIEAIRFGKKLQYSIDVPPELYGCSIPSLILQPIVENAILHGVFPLDRPGMIRILARQRDRDIVLIVSDNGDGFKTHRFVEGVGLGNTRARLEQLYGTDHTFTLGVSDEGGASVAMSFPLEYSAVHDKDTHGTQSASRR